MAVRSALVDHMVSIPAVLGGNVEDYLALGMSHLLNTQVYSYLYSFHT